MQQVTTEPARPLDTAAMPWIPTGPGKFFRPLRFTAGGWSELMRLDPGRVVAFHRHTGDLHALNVAGRRQIIGTGEVVGPGGYVYEPAGTVDTWGAVGDEPCVIHLKVVGEIEYLDEDGQVIDVVSSASQRSVYLAWCQRSGVAPDPQILAEG
jgi:2,4'-dihydroxyacetophenone dioxygenase